MGTKSKKKYKLLSLLMAFALLVTTCLPMSAMAAGTEGADCVKVSSTAPTEEETVAGAKYELDLSKVFTDSDSHSLSYTLESIKLGDADSKYTQYTQIKGNNLYFTANRAGTYTVNLKATCSDKKSVSYALTMNVTAADEGTKAQYSYDETNADKVTVWVTMSSDGVPLMGNDEDSTKLSHLKVTVPYFDLSAYGLGQFARKGTAEDPNMGHKGDYINNTVIERPTYLHLLIWLTERYYLGLPEEQCGHGQDSSHVIDNTNTTSVKTIFGKEAYSSNGLSAFGLKDGTASATSMLINNLWGHDMNFMYLRNHVYPLMDAGWGATADYILLSDNDVLDIALFSDWTFYQRGAFNKFDQEVYTAAPGSELTFSTLKYDTQSPSEGGAGDFTKIDKLNIGLYNADWEKVSDVEIDGSGGDYYIDVLPEVEGTYYLLGMDPLADTENSYTACYAPAVAELDIKKADPFEGMPFTDLYYMDGDTKVQLKKIAQKETLTDASFYMPFNAPSYEITVPKSLADTGLDVYITYPNTQTLKAYAYLYKDSKVNYSPQPTVAVDTETNTLKITVTKDYIDADGTYVLAEDSSYKPFMGFGFVSGDITPSKPSDGKVTGVTLDKTSLTMPRWTTATLTATVQPENANVKIVKWSSSDDSIVSVEKGVLTSHKAGEADITVMTVKSEKTAKCHVTVTDSDKPQDIEGIYQISNAKELLWLANEVNTSVKGTVINATLTQDIDLSGLDGTTRARESWPAIGISTDHPYTGTFDGNGRTVQNLYGDYQATGDKTVYVGLFGVTDKATIKNVTVTGTISAVSDGYNDSVNIGGICGSASSTTIENCHNQVVLNGGTGRLDSVGGIVGKLYSGSITSCSNKAAITGKYAAGIASSASGSISGCWNEGTITGKESYMTGGIVAEAGRLSITDCNNKGTVTATGQSTMPYTRVGGICGSVANTIGGLTCQNCYNTGELSAEGNEVALYGVGPVSSGTSFGTSNYTNCFYTNTGDAITPVLGVQPISPSEQKDVAAAFSGDSWKDSCPLPVLKGQTATEHADNNSDGNCDACEKVMNPTSAYTISAAQNQMINLSDEVTVTLTVGSKNQETTYNAYALKVTYDADLLTFKELTKVDGSTQKVSDDKQGTLTITGYGADCAIGTNNIDLIFVGRATGGAKVKIESANIDKQANANAQDAPAAAITSAIAFVNITNEYPVSFDKALFTGNSTVKAGEKYTLTARDKNYNYTVTATMGGEPVDVTSGNGDIYFYVNNVNGPLVFSVEKRTPKTYTVTVDTTGTGKDDLILSSDKATYSEEYTFIVNKEAGYGYTVSAKAEVYQGISNNKLPLTQEKGTPFTKDGKTYTPYTYKIAGADIVSKFVIKVDKEIDNSQWTQITFTGEGSADVVNGPDQKGLNDKPFQFRLNKSEGFEYTVKENGTKLQADKDGNYTIPASRMTGTALTVTVEKKGELTIVAKEYLKLKNSENENGKTMWLITATGAVNAGKTLAYDTNTMYWSAKYNEGKGAYAYLVIYDNEIEDQNGQKQAVTKELVESKAKEKIQESSSTKVTIAYDGDVNGTTKLDINDAQLVYNMYNAMYEDFDTVYVKKFLEADMNGDGTVNVSDAAAVVEALANAK